MEKIVSIKEVYSVGIGNKTPTDGSKGASLGMSDMIGFLGGGGNYDGYQVETTKNTYSILISNGQSCCENWGYLSSDDDFDDYIGAELMETRLTDTALNTAKLEEEHLYGFDEGEIQFVDFVTNKGVFQLAVYNSHNGYYGHGIFFIKNDEILLSDTL